MSKPRSDSPLKNLSEERQEQIIEWCNAPKTDACVGGYKFAKQQLADDGIKVSEGALSEFYSWWHLRRDFTQAEHQTEDIVELIKRLDPKLTAEQLETAGQLIFTQRAIAARNSEEFREMEKLRLAKETARTRGRQEERRLEIAERRVALLEENQSKAKAELQKVVAKGGLSKDTLETIEQAAKLL